MENLQAIEHALTFIDAADRKTWTDCGMGIKNDLGEAGFYAWDRWSATADSYCARDAASSWKSFKRGGGITIATLFKLARDSGYSNSVLSVLSEISIESENLIENQSLSGEKESAPEKPEVKTRENDGLKLLKDKCGSYLDEINLNLNRITNSAINFEVKNARDDVVKICAIIQCCK